MKKIKVLHFELSEQIGGIESFLLNLYSNIDREQIAFDFVTTSKTPALRKELEQLGGRIYGISSYCHFFNYKKDIKKLLFQNQYDVVHIHKNSAANIVPFDIVSKVNEKPVVIVHSHNTAPSIGKFTKLLHYLNRDRMFKISDYHFACSKKAAKWMFGDLHQKNICIIPNGIEMKKFVYTDEKAKIKREELGIADETFVLGHIGRFTEQKNHLFLINIFKNILLINPNSVLILIGTGELKSKIESLVSMLGIEEHVLFLGARTDIPELLFAMDAFILPSLYEGLPIAAVEAQAAGLPIFLADTISKETDLANCVSWFSLENAEEEVARKILSQQYGRNEIVRQERNKKMSNSAYNIKTTATELQKIYLTSKKGK